jgi:hypothetical protein
MTRRNVPVLERALKKLKAAADFDDSVTLDAEEAAQVWLHIRTERYRHRRRWSL